MIAAAVLLFLLPFAMVNMAAPAPAAYLALDINPSVELALDQNGRVLAAEALNEDGATVLQGLALKNLPIAKAILAIVHRAQETGYCPPDTEHTLFLTVSPAQDEKTILLESQALSPHQICATVQSELAAAHLPVQVTGGQVQAEVREQARAQAMSVNRYLAQTGAAKRGLDLTELPGKSIRGMEQALEKHGLSLADLLAGEYRAEIRKGRDRPQRDEHERDRSEKQWSSKEARSRKNDPPKTPNRGSGSNNGAGEKNQRSTGKDQNRHWDGKKDNAGRWDKQGRPARPGHSRSPSHHAHFDR
jgi:hypothetical protein